MTEREKEYKGTWREGAHPYGPPPGSYPPPPPGAWRRPEPTPGSPYGGSGCGTPFPTEPFMGREPQSNNGMGIAGFVLSLLAFLLGWLPFMGMPLAILGLIFSAIGLGRRPRGLAIAGLVISIAYVVVSILLIVLVGVMFLENSQFEPYVI